MISYSFCLNLFFSLRSHSIFAFDVDPVGKNVKEGVERYKSQNYQGALESFNEAESQAKEDDRLFFNKGTGYYKLNDYKLALKYFEKSALSNDKDLRVKSLYNKGNTYAKLGDKKNAIRSYLDALSSNPDFLPARKNLEMLSRKQNQEDQKQEQENKESSDDKNKSEQNKKQEQSKNKKENQQNQTSEQNENNQKDEKNKESNQKMSKEEAERILESAKQNKINRKKMNERPQDRNDIFW